MLLLPLSIMSESNSLWIKHDIGAKQWFPEDVGWMLVLYVGHRLLMFELSWMLIKGTDGPCPPGLILEPCGPGRDMSQRPAWTNVRLRILHFSPVVSVCVAFLCVCVFAVSSAAFSRVPRLGLEGESGLWRAQPHLAGEQEAGQGPGEPVPQWVSAAQHRARSHCTEPRLIHPNAQKYSVDLSVNVTVNPGWNKKIEQLISQTRC